MYFITIPGREPYFNFTRIMKINNIISRLNETLNLKGITLKKSYCLSLQNKIFSVQ